MDGRAEYWDSGISYLGTEERGGRTAVGWGLRDVTFGKCDC